MKTKITFLIVLCILLATSSCRLENDPADQSATDHNVSGQDYSTSKDSIEKLSLPYLTHYNDETEQFEVKENPEHIPPINMEGLLTVLSDKYPKIPLVIDHIANDTLYVKIPDATYFTQNMGTSGASAFLVEATYGFTTLQNIEVVNFEFEEGDHAVPGPYTRTSFSEFLK